MNIQASRSKTIHKFLAERKGIPPQQPKQQPDTNQE